MVLTIRGETPAKKNSRINTRSGRSFPNKRYAEWLDSALGQVSRQMAAAYAEDREWQVPPGKSTRMTVTFYHGDFKRRDSDNQLSSILDMLVEAGVLPDDCWEVLPEKHTYDAYDKGNPRCIVSLEVMGDNIFRKQ